MKKYWQLSFTCLGLAMALTLTGCGSIVEKSSNLVIGEGSGTGELVSQEIKTFAGDQFERIDIVTDVMEVVVQQGEGAEAMVELLKDDKISSDIAFDASIQANVLQVTVNTQSKLLSVGEQRGERKLIVTLPAEHEPELDIKNEFGKVTLDGVTVSAATVELDAGTINASAVKGNLDLNIDAGDIVVQQAEGSYPITAYTEAGNIDIAFAEAPTVASFNLMVEVGKVQLGIDDVTYEEKRNTLIKAERGSGGPLIKAIATAGNIKVNEMK